MYRGGWLRYYVDMRGKFIVVDGMDGSGKGTQMRLLQGALANQPFVFTREPGGTPRAEEIRKDLLRQEGAVSNPTCDFFLFWAARASHVEDFVEPTRTQGTHVITDRYDSSTFAFQIHGEERSNLEPVFHAVRKSLPTYYLPDAYIILDLPASVAFERRKADQGQDKSKFDVKPIEYHERVRNGFLALKEFAPLHVVDASRTPEEMHADVLRIVREVTV